nr:phosphoenolpyruvate carboxylase [Paludibacterium denitrificans]
MTDQDKDLPLRQDLLRLDRLLGEVLQEQEGPQVYQEMRAIAQRQGAERTQPLPDSLSAEAATALVRACGLYAQLFNIAEDLHHTRRRKRAHRLAGSAPQQGSFNRALSRLKQNGVSFAALSEALQNAYVGAILTAHPTEVQRQSVLDGHRAVRKFLTQLNAGDVTPEEERELDAKLKRVILVLWQTSEIRHFKLSVKDEIENGVAYHPLTFFSALPRLYEQLSHEVQATWGETPQLPSFIRVGSWIGGDRDGNPNVDADVLRHAITRQAEVAFAHYQYELAALYREWSLSARHVSVSAAVQVLADATPDLAESRREEPYRRALASIEARLAATAAALGVPVTNRWPGATPYANCQALQADLTALAGSLRDNGSALLAEGRLARLIRAVDVFGFFLMPLDLRQFSGSHEAVVSELLAKAGLEEYAALDEAARIRVLLRELATPRLLYSPYLQYSAETQKELAIFREAARIQAAFGQDAIGQSIISNCASVSDILELALTLKETGLIRLVDGQPVASLNLVPLFEMIADLDAVARSWTRCLRCHGISCCSRAAA